MSVMFAAALMLAPQTAPAAADLADAKCVGAMTVLGEKADEKDKGGMQSAMMFFLGKIVGRSGAGAVGPSLQAAVTEMKPGGEAGLAAIAEQCAVQVEQATSGF